MNTTHDKIKHYIKLLMEEYDIDSYLLVYTTEEDIGHFSDIKEDFYSLLGGIERAKSELILNKHDEDLIEGHNNKL